ncbi:MAG: hypothetical protein LBL30_00180 [Holosporales bacterium]|jgi:type II secretory pathway component PulF|nr:hypothetical protein [Holosporales bacterium]
MPVYKYCASDRSGIRSTGFIIADNRNGARSELFDRRLIPIKCCISFKIIIKRFLGIGVKHEDLLLFFPSYKISGRDGA